MAVNIGIIGGGLTGLASGFTLSQAGHHVTVYEAAKVPGGTIATKRRDGFVLEQGAGSVRGASRDVYQLFIDAGLSDAVIPASDAASARFLVHDGALVPLPNGPGGLFGIPGLGRRGALRLLQEPFRPAPRYGSAEESVHQFLTRRIGARAADALGDPMMAGIFAGDPRQIEVASAFPAWVRYEREHGSMVRGVMRNQTTPPAGLPKGTFSVRSGIGTLTDTLAAKLGDRLRLGTSVKRLTLARWGVTVHVGRKKHEHEQLIVTAPPSCARSLLPDAPPGWLDDLPQAPLAAIHLAYDAAAVPGGLPGFGWLVHSKQRADALGCLWVSGTFPSHAPAGQHLLRIMVGGARAPHMAEWTDERLTAHAKALLAEVQGITAEPLFTEVNRASIPQYPVGFARRLRLLDQVHPRVRFAGWHWGQLGVAASAEASARMVRDYRAR